MYKASFKTTTYMPGEFTSGWMYLTERNGQPCKGTITIEDDRVLCESVENFFSLNALLEAPHIGKVMMRTSVVKAHDTDYDLLEELIKGRIGQIEEVLTKTDTEIQTSFKDQLQSLSHVTASLDTLGQLMALGEEIIMKDAERVLQIKIQNNEMEDFLLGGQAFGIKKDEKYRKIHIDYFNLGIAPIYFFVLKNEAQNKTDWSLTDEIVDFLVRTKRPIKAHPLVWLHKYARPDWMLSLTFEELKEFLKEHLTLVINRYKEKINMWDIVNEMPAIDANGFDLSIEQLLEITKMTSDLVKELQPEAERIINFSEIFGAHSYIHEKPSIPPVHFLELCREYGIEYESIGLQFYMGMKKEFVCRELLNISQTVDSFLQFNKKIHFSELGWPSKHDTDPDCFFSSDHPEVAGRWHENWSEELQAEFLKKIYTLFASKKNAQSITWWDITDNGRHEDIGSRFIPFAGLTRRDYSPKPALLALQEFRQSLKNS